MENIIAYGNHRDGSGVVGTGSQKKAGACVTNSRYLLLKAARNIFLQCLPPLLHESPDFMQTAYFCLNFIDIICSPS